MNQVGGNFTRVSNTPVAQAHVAVGCLLYGFHRARFNTKVKAAIFKFKATVDFHLGDIGGLGGVENTGNLRAHITGVKHAVVVAARAVVYNELEGRQVTAEVNHL